MSKKSLLALLAFATFAAAVIVGMGASAAFAGEVTGNCNHAGSATAQDNCKGEDSEADRVSNGNSWCSFSGQNDGTPPAGNAQSFGQDVSAGRADPSELKGGDGSPGTECNPNKTNFPPIARK